MSDTKSIVEWIRGQQKHPTIRQIRKQFSIGSKKASQCQHKALGADQVKKFRCGGLVHKKQHAQLDERVIQWVRDQPKGQTQITVKMIREKFKLGSERANRLQREAYGMPKRQKKRNANVKRGTPEFMILHWIRQRDCNVSTGQIRWEFGVGSEKAARLRNQARSRSCLEEAVQRGLDMMPIPLFPTTTPAEPESDQPILDAEVVEAPTDQSESSSPPPETKTEPAQQEAKSEPQPRNPKPDERDAPVLPFVLPMPVVHTASAFLKAAGSGADQQVDYWKSFLTNIKTEDQQQAQQASLTNHDVHKQQPQPPAGFQMAPFNLDAMFPFGLDFAKAMPMSLDALDNIITTSRTK